MVIFIAVALLSIISMAFNSPFSVPVPVIFTVSIDGTIAGITIGGVLTAIGLTFQSS